MRNQSCKANKVNNDTHRIFRRILLTTSSILARDCSVGNNVLIYSTALKSGLSSGSVLGMT